jgi:hypothetical protein
LCGLFLVISCQQVQNNLDSIAPEEALFSSEKLKSVDCMSSNDSDTPLSDDIALS